MLPRNTSQSNLDKEQQKNESEPRTRQDENVKAAHDQAEEDIEQDADFSLHSPNDDLDEGESARLGEDRNDLA
jgi:hypothetical protein